MSTCAHPSGRRVWRVQDEGNPQRQMVEVDDPEDGTKPPGAELERIQEEIDQDPKGPAFTNTCTPKREPRSAAVGCNYSKE